MMCRLSGAVFNGGLDVFGLPSGSVDQRMKYLFGPVNSRRLGLSLGIDLVPAKVCNFNCIYCEVGPTTDLTCERKEYIPTADILAEIDAFLAQDKPPAVDVFTLTAMGEPTLHSGIGEVVRYLKARTGKPVALLTNGSLLHLPEVRRELLELDIVIPSLDAARPESYRRINRPAHCAGLDEVIEGIRCFNQEFRGELWLEVLLAAGVNDAPEDIEALKAAIARIEPARVQLNTVARPPLEAFARPLTRRRMEEVAAELGKKFNGDLEILVDFSRRARENFHPIVDEEIVEMLKRRPCTVPDICESLNLEETAASAALARLETEGRVTPKDHGGRRYYQAAMDSPARGRS